MKSPEFIVQQLSFGGPKPQGELRDWLCQVGQGLRFWISVSDVEEALLIDRPKTPPGVEPLQVQHLKKGGAWVYHVRSKPKRRGTARRAMLPFLRLLMKVGLWHERQLGLDEFRGLLFERRFNAPRNAADPYQECEIRWTVEFHLEEQVVSFKPFITARVGGGANDLPNPIESALALLRVRPLKVTAPKQMRQGPRPGTICFAEDFFHCLEEEIARQEKEIEGERQIVASSQKSLRRRELELQNLKDLSAPAEEQE